MLSEFWGYLKMTFSPCFHELNATVPLKFWPLFPCSLGSELNSCVPLFVVRPGAQIYTGNVYWSH